MRDKCKNLLRYLAVGCVEDTFGVWKEDTRKTVTHYIPRRILLLVLMYTHVHI